MTKRPNDLEWVPPTQPKDYVKCSVCGAGWLLEHALVVGGEIFCSDKCGGERAVDLLLQQKDDDESK